MARHRRRAYVNNITDSHAMKAFVESHQVRGTDLYGEICAFMQSTLKDWSDRPHLRVMHGLSGPLQIEIDGARAKVYRFSSDLLGPPQANTRAPETVEKRELYFSTNDRGQMVSIIRKTMK